MTGKVCDGGGAVRDDYTLGMFELTVQRQFCAAHAIEIKGHMEPVHGHNWTVTIVVAGEALDDNGLVYDFHQLEHWLDQIIEPFHNHDLNATPPFDEINPTAEHVAQHIGQSMVNRLPEQLALLSASVTEAPGCIATWRP